MLKREKGEQTGTEMTQQDPGHGGGGAGRLRKLQRGQRERRQGRAVPVGSVYRQGVALDTYRVRGLEEEPGTQLPCEEVKDVWSPDDAAETQLSLTAWPLP